MGTTMSPAEGIEIRDMFLRVYPLEEFPIKEKTTKISIEIPENNKSLLLDAVKALKGREIK
jgi:hypothetical protein